MNATGSIITPCIILEELGDHRDYEWYDEDFAGRYLMDETIIPNETVLNAIEQGMCGIFHISLALG